MIDVDEKELPALHKWNSAQLLKRKNRSLKLRVLAIWKRATEKCMDAQIHKLDEQITLLNQQINTQQIFTPKSNTYVSSTNENLRQQLEKLKEEQKQLEKDTTVVKEELANVKKQSYSRTRYTTCISRH